jgi:hypothetical protein
MQNAECKIQAAFETMRVTNLAGLNENEFAGLEAILAKHKTLRDFLAWAGSEPKEDFLPQIVAEVVIQDEYTHDVVLRYKRLFLVYDTN